jgi:hypothetical protein
MELPEEIRREATRLNALGALEVNQTISRNKGKAPNSALLSAAHQFARFLHLGHLSTLATFYLDYLARRCEYAAALPDWVEAMADAGGEIEIDRDNLLAKGAQDELELANYALGRALIRRGVPEAFIEQLPNDAAADFHDTNRAVANARSALLIAHAFLSEEKVPVPFEAVSKIVDANPGWRYAARVQLAMLAHVTPKTTDLPLKVLDRFLATFGNDGPTWADFDENSEPGVRWLDGMYSRSSREVVALPHDRSAWESLTVHLDYDEAKSWRDDISSRIRQQCA